MNYRIEYAKKGIPGYLYKYADSARELLVVLTDFNTEWIDFETIKVSLPPVDQDNMNNITYLWSNGMVDNIAKKVAEEPMENVDDRPQHVIDEERVDLIKEKRKEQAQMEMFDDPVMNWSGLR